MAVTEINRDDILNTKITWKDVIGYNSEDVNPYHTKRINNYLDNCYPEKLNNKNLDLSTLLIILKNRGCVIEIPNYENTTIKKIKSNVTKVGDVRRGKIIALRSNQNTFKFSVTIMDEMYVEKMNDGTEQITPRTYTITDDYGNFHDNWDKFVFDLTNKEICYFGESLNKEHQIRCDKFVNLQLAQSMYTDYYRNMKLLIDRLVAERKYLNDTRKKYLTQCDIVSTDELRVIQETKVEDENEYESKIIKCFEVLVSNSPKEYNFNYIDTTKKPEEIVAECDKYLKGIVDCTSEYKFLCRMIEFAFTKMNPYKENLQISELQTYNRVDCKWNEQKVKLPRSRIEWFELMFKDYSLLCRYFDKTIKVKKA